METMETDRFLTTLDFKCVDDMVAGGQGASMRMSNIVWVGIGLVVGCGLGIALVCKGRRDPIAHAGYLVAEQPLVDWTIKDYANEHHASVVDAMRGRFAVVMSFDTHRCVSLKLRPGVIGWVPVYCFSRDSNRLIYRRLRQG